MLLSRITPPTALIADVVPARVVRVAVNLEISFRLEALLAHVTLKGFDMSMRAHLVASQ